MMHRIFAFYKHRCGPFPDTEREHGLARGAIERFLPLAIQVVGVNGPIWSCGGNSRGVERRV